LYEPRIYRKDMNRERFRFFRVLVHESDLLLGVPKNDFRRGMAACVEKELIRLRELVLEHSKIEPGFLQSLDPLDLPVRGSNVADEIRTMITCGLKTGTGPMASVAGLFAQQAGKKLVSDYGINEVIVENGGDLYVRNEQQVLSMIHAGSSSISDRMAFVIPPGEWGICTSSGTMGHSFSQGNADALTVVMHSAPLADSWATALANRVSSAGDMDGVLAWVAGIHDILGFALIIDEQIGIRGELEVKMLTSDR
jgi:ApbE superfamily uncharacterized protein (UPF0280 family)